MSGAYRREDLGAIRARSLELARDFLGLAFKRQGSSWKALCPFHRETTPSFDYRDDTQTFRCFGCGWAGGDIFALYSAIHSGATFRQAMVALGGRLGTGNRHSARAFGAQAPAATTMAATTTTHAVAPDHVHQPPRHPRCVGRWRYTNADGGTLGFQDRITDGIGKRFTSWRWNETAESWEPRAIAKPRPLYGLADPVLRSDAAVIVCEGEKATDAARAAFPQNVCVTSMGGSAAARSTDWSPLRGRAIRLWPDNDDARYRYACEVAAILGAMSTTLLVVRPLSSMPSGWDLADALPAGTNLRDLHRLLIEARSLKGNGR